MPQLKGTPEFDRMQPFFDLIIKGTLERNSAVVMFKDLLLNVTSFENFLQSSVKMGPALVDAFLTSAISIDSVCSCDFLSLKNRMQ